MIDVYYLDSFDNFMGVYIWNLSNYILTCNSLYVDYKNITKCILKLYTLCAVSYMSIIQNIISTIWNNN